MIQKQQFLIFFVMALGLFLLIGSCKDMGNEPSPPAPKPVTAGQNSFTLVPGGNAATNLSGGTPPYSFVSRGDTGVVLPSIVGDSLRIVAVTRGSSTIIVGDNGSPRLTVTISVTVKQLVVAQTSFNLFAGDSVSTTVSGGTLPYSFVSRGDTTKALPSISGSLLRIQAVAPGGSMIIVGDNGSPRLTDTISVTIAALISFASQIQPIFTASCVNAGCHPGNGAPFPLQAGVSYNSLVGVAATNGIGQCPGDKRVESSNAGASVLIKRITGTCGLAQMPLGLTPLPSGQIQLIRDWINQGARNN